MAQPRGGTPVYLEIGNKRTFAGAIDWPGWCRSGRDEVSALEAMVAYGSRYALAIATAQPGMAFPASPSDLDVVERLEGSSTTDFGAPGAVSAADESPVGPVELFRLGILLRACWQTFDQAAASAAGRTLRKGPRGGGRDLAGIVQHITDANRAYLARLAWKQAQGPASNSPDQVNQLLDENLQAVAVAAAGGLPGSGPRGGKLWAPRYFVRRTAWHLLDHAWEIEDRLL